MRVRKRRNAFVLLGKIAQRRNGVNELFPHKDERLAHSDDIGVIADIAARCAEVDYRLCVGAALAEGEHMRHNVVAHLVLVPGRRLVVDIVNVRFHLLYLRIAYIESKLLLTLGKGDPQSAPGRELEVIGEKALHLFSGISPTQGIFIKFVFTHLSA